MTKWALSNPDKALAQNVKELKRFIAMHLTREKIVASQTLSEKTPTSTDYPSIRRPLIES